MRIKLNYTGNVKLIYFYVGEKNHEVIKTVSLYFNGNEMLNYNIHDKKILGNNLFNIYCIPITTLNNMI